MTNELFRLIRLHYRYSQRELAELIGVSNGLVAYIETDKRAVSPRTVAKVKAALGLTDADFETIAKLQTALKGGNGPNERQ
jgi:transcriptional regulator with XRE-family HTH domain